MESVSRQGLAGRIGVNKQAAVGMGNECRHGVETGKRSRRSG